MRLITPEEFIHTQRGARLYFLWQREKNPRKREEYQRMFNEELERINLDNVAYVEMYKE